MKVADYVAQFLKLQGVSHIFGLPGGENVVFLEAVRQAGINFVLVTHEAAAGFAAGVTGELTNRPGICLSTVGPGAVNLVAAAAAATLERSPVLAITADIDSGWQGRVRHMRLDLTTLFDPVTKGSFRLSPESLDDTLRLAWELALAPPQGAVHLILSPDQASMPFMGSPVRLAPAKTHTSKKDALLSAASHFLDAEELLIIAGLGIAAAQAQNELLTLAEIWQAPVAVTPKAKGCFPESHPLFAGCFTAYGDAPLRKAVAEADLVLGVGLDSVDFVTSTWDYDTPVINLNSAEADDPALKPVVAIDGDLQELLQKLIEDEMGYHPGLDAEGRAAAIRQSIALQLQEPNGVDTVGTIPIQALISNLQDTLPERGALTIDVGAFKLVFLQQWRTDRPKSLFVANGLSAMGYAIPGALAIGLAQPNRPVAAIVGDGALLMYAGELATVARLGTPMVILVIVDDALSLIRLKQLRQKVTIYGTEFGHVDYNALARAFGLEYRLIDSESVAETALSDAIRLKRPVLVEARITNAEYDRFR